jgi:glutaconate CoA-transferase, subunit A
VKQARRLRARPPRVIPAEAMAAGIEPDSQVAFAGGMGMHLPCEAARQLVKRGLRARVMTSAAGYAVDLLIRGGVVQELQFAFCSLDELGLSPAFRRAVDRQEFPLAEMDSPVMLAGLRAGMCGLAWMPLPNLGNSIPQLTPGLFETEAETPPGTVAVRAIAPDVAYLQAAYCDSAGNIYYRDTAIMDFMFAAASRRVVVTVEEMRPDSDVIPGEARIPAFLVDEIVIGEGLGHPGAVPGYYQADHAVIRAESIAPFAKKEAAR